MDLQVSRWLLLLRRLIVTVIHSIVYDFHCPAPTSLYTNFLCAVFVLCPSTLLLAFSIFFLLSFS